LVLSVLLWPRFRRAYPALGLSLALGWIAALAFYGAWWAWHGGWSWGPRFVVPLVPLSCLPLGMLPASRRWHALAAGLIALGVVVQIPGVLVDAVPYYAGLDGPDYAAFRLAPRDSPLIWAARQVIAGQTEPLALFHLRGSGLPPAWWIGTPALAVIGAAVGAWRIMRGAILTARKAPPS
jgi:hypothetical protein